MTKQAAAFLSILSNASLVTLKIIAGLMMGSVSVLSEAVHSGVDLIASLVAFISIKKSNVPADKDHPYGHGKFENISGFFEAILIFVAAGLIISGAVKKLIHPVAVESLDWGIFVMLVSVLVNIGVSRILFRIAKREGSIALEADALHLSVDVFTSLGVMVGLIAMRFTGLSILDPVIALCVAALILRASWDLTRRSLDDLADKSLPNKELAAIREILGRHPSIQGFHRLRSRKSGNQKEIDIHIKIDGKTDVYSAHELCNEIEKDIKAVLEHTYVVVHVEPFHPNAP